MNRSQVRGYPLEAVVNLSDAAVANGIIRTLPSNLRKVCLTFAGLTSGGKLIFRNGTDAAAPVIFGIVFGINGNIQVNPDMLFDQGIYMSVQGLNIGTGGIDLTLIAEEAYERKAPFVQSMNP